MFVWMQFLASLLKLKKVILKIKTASIQMFNVEIHHNMDETMKDGGIC